MLVYYFEIEAVKIKLFPIYKTIDVRNEINITDNYGAKSNLRVQIERFYVFTIFLFLIPHFMFLFRCNNVLLNRMSIEETPKQHSNDPLHSVRLDTMLEYLVDEYGWPALGLKIKVNCFNNNPSMQSSLKFLRKTPWARAKVEQLYLETKREGFD